MKAYRVLGPALCAAMVMAVPVKAQVRTPRPSQKASVMQTVGLTDVTVTYSRPGVKGRQIWGGLVPYDQPWRTGANEATSFVCSEDISVDGQKLAAGTYSFFTIPGKAEWTVVFNKEKDLWGAYEYKPEQDALRLKVKPQTTATAEEWMQFRFDDVSWRGATLALYWEKLMLPLHIGVDDVDQVLAAVRDTIGRAPATDWRTPYRGADFCFNAETNMDEGLKWLEKSVATQEGYYNVSLLARYRAKMGKKPEAITLAQKALELAKASKDELDTKPTERLLAEWTAKK